MNFSCTIFFINSKVSLYKKLKRTTAPTVNVFLTGEGVLGTGDVQPLPVLVLTGSNYFSIEFVFRLFTALASYNDVRVEYLVLSINTLTNKSQLVV